MLNKINVQTTRLSGVVVKQMDQGLLKAKDEYSTSVKLAARGLEADHGPWVVAQGITPALFEMWSVGLFNTFPYVPRTVFVFDCIYAFPKIGLKIRSVWGVSAFRM